MADEVVNTAVYKIEIDASGAQSELQKIDTAVEDSGKKVEKKSSLASRALNKVWDTAVSGVKSSFINSFSSITSSITSFPKQILSVGAGFEQSMANVSAIMGASGDDLDRLTNKARELGKSTQYSSSEVADGLSYMAMAGWDTEQALAGIDSVLQLATAGGMDLATTSDIVTDALTAFGYKASDAGKFADVLAATSSSANTNVGLMGETFKYVAPVAGAMGYSVEDTATAIGLMANAGIKGSQAGTSLRSILQRLANDTQGAATVLNDMGVAIKNEDGSMRDFGDVINDMRSAFAGLSAEEKINLATTIAGAEGMSGFLAIVEASPEDFDKLTGAIAGSEGASKHMSDVMQNTTAGKLKALQAKVQELATKGFDLLKPAIDMTIVALGWCVDHAEMLIPVLGVLGAAIVAIKVGNFAKQLKSTFGGALKTTKNFAKKLTGVFQKDIGNKVSKEAEKSVGKVGDTTSKKISGLGTTISTAFKSLGEILSSVIGAILEPIKTLFKGIGEAIAGFFSALANPAIAVGAAMFAAVAAVIAAAILLIGAAIGLTMPTWEALFNKIIIPMAIFIRDTVLMVIDNLTSNLVKLTNEALIPLGEFIINSFLGIVKGVTDAIVNFTQDAVIPLINTMSGALMGVLETVSDFLNNTLKTAFEGVKGIIDSIGTAFEKMGGVIVRALEGVNGILGTFKDLLIGIADAVVAVVALATGQSVNYGRGFAKVTKAALGGRVGGIGTETSDSNLFALSKGEYVIRASSARQIGYENLDQLNANGTLAGVNNPRNGNDTFNIYVEGVFATSPDERRKVASQIVAAIRQNDRRLLSD